MDEVLMKKIKCKQLILSSAENVTPLEHLKRKSTRKNAAHSA